MPINLDIRKNALVIPIIEEFEEKLNLKDSQLKEKDFQLEEQNSQIENTIKRLLQKKTFSIEEVADITGESIALVQQIKEKIENS